eukprot:2736863-Pleurochrysis_carterae.AAC.1
MQVSPPVWLGLVNEHVLAEVAEHEESGAHGGGESERDEEDDRVRAEEGLADGEVDERAADGAERHGEPALFGGVKGQVQDGVQHEVGQIVQKAEGRVALVRSRGREVVAAKTGAARRQAKRAET